MFWNTMYLQLLEYPNLQVDDKRNRWNCEDISVQDPMFLFWFLIGPPIRMWHDNNVLWLVGQWGAFLSCCRLYKWVHNRIELEQHSLDGFLYLTKFQEVNEEQFLDYSKFQDLEDWLLKDLLISGSKCQQFSKVSTFENVHNFQNVNDFQNVNIWKCQQFRMSTFRNVHNF